MCQLEEFPFESYIRHMNTRTLRATFLQMVPGAGHQFDAIHRKVSKHDLPKMLRYVYHNVKPLEEVIEHDPHLDLPILPFWRLFIRAERTIMALLYTCQLEGLFMNSKIKLAKNGIPVSLPRPYHHYDLTDDSLIENFPLSKFDGKTAAYFLEMVTDTTSSELPTPDKFNIFLDPTV
ncbi:hypothetical protein GQ44DRAFT_755256 [Phaeosphaeriaceae sp. PMI808]|nr:hypothetical protein GQ44DRAFT_755256 [Phaeosphaeriaceae sp. PMI808]